MKEKPYFIFVIQMDEVLLWCEVINRQTVFIQNQYWYCSMINANKIQKIEKTDQQQTRVMRATS